MMPSSAPLCVKRVASIFSVAQPFVIQPPVCSRQPKVWLKPPLRGRVAVWLKLTIGSPRRGCLWEQNA